MNQEEIEARKERSHKKFQERKLKQQAYNAMIQSGVQAVHEHRDNIIIREINEDITFAAERSVSNTGGVFVIFSYAFRRHADTPSSRISKGILGTNLVDGRSIVEVPFSYELFELAKEQGSRPDAFLVNMAVNSLVIGILVNSVDAPLWAQKQVEGQVI